MHNLYCALVTAILLLQFMPFSLLFHLCIIFNVMGLCPVYILFLLQSFGKYTSVFIIPSNCAFCLSLKNYEQMQSDCVNRPKKDTQNHIHLPWIRKQWLRLKQVGEKAVRVIENECWLIVCWVLGKTGTEHSPPVVTVLWLHFVAEFCFTSLLRVKVWTQSSELAWLLCATWCFFLLVHNVTTGLLKANLFWQLVDNVPQELSGCGEAQNLSLSLNQVLSKHTTDSIYTSTWSLRQFWTEVCS